MSFYQTQSTDALRTIDQEFFRCWTVSLELSACYITWHYVTKTSHLYSLRDFWRHFGLSRVAAHSDYCFFAPCTNIRTYLLTVIDAVITLTAFSSKHSLAYVRRSVCLFYLFLTLIYLLWLTRGQYTTYFRNGWTVELVFGTKASLSKSYFLF